MQWINSDRRNRVTFTVPHNRASTSQRLADSRRAAWARLMTGACLLASVGCGATPPADGSTDQRAASEVKRAEGVPPSLDPTAGQRKVEPSRVDPTAADEPTVDESTVKDPADLPAGHLSQPVNRLAQESSPYLRMHMHNPVDWYPWGPAAFQKASRENKIVFLSVGYSSCYWCHVMERESFMDDEIAAFLNKHFVCVKVDREERPDVDSIYMMAVQLMTRRGGWPMSVFLTPEGKPFFGGTYFPARDGDRAGGAGFLTVIRRVQDAWTNESPEIRQTADVLTDAIQQEMLGPTAADGAPLDTELVQQVVTALAASFDDQYGGFGYSSDDPRRPKFPEASNLEFLLDRIQNANDEQCRRMLTTTLDRMARGGIWDHVGGGFHRYSTDRFWHIPHFEKMLYDNGQLLSVYSHAYKLTGNERYRQIVDATVAFMMREMRGESGALYSALDAESEQVEGKYYRWTKEEVADRLGDQFGSFAAIYGLDGRPNFEEHFYVLQLSRPLADIAQEQQQTLTQLDEQLQPLREELLRDRGQRVPPLTDDKILCSWNALAIRGLADAGRYCDRPEYVRAAAQAADFVLRELKDADGRLLRTYRDGEAKLNAYLDDYAFMVNALIGLYKASDDRRWLDEADRLSQQQIELFWDDQRGGFFFTANDHESLIARTKQLTDGAQPSGNSVAAGNLLELARILERPDYRERGEQTIRTSMPLMKQMPRVAPRMAVALAAALDENESSDR